jgi:hypothetical protein
MAPLEVWAMSFFRLFLFLPLLFACALATGQVQSNPAQKDHPDQETVWEPKLARRPPELPDSVPIDSPQVIPLTVPPGTPIRIALAKRVRISREGEQVEGKVADTVFAFDQPVILAGTEVQGHVKRVLPVSTFRRTMAMADADFTPAHEYTVEFDTLVLSGKSLPLATAEATGTEDVVHLVSDQARKDNQKKNAATRAVDQAKHDVSNDVHQAVAEIEMPGRMHRFKRYLLAQSPYRRQYLEAGTRFDAELKQPLSFGSVVRMPNALSAIGVQPPADATLHARLAEEVSSATAHKGTPVEAVITQPVFDPEHKLLLPANSVIVGEVTQVKPAGKLHHNGELRFNLKKISTPDGKDEAVQGSLKGIEAGQAASMKLDAEGGVRAVDSKTRYLSTGISIAIAAVAAHPESDNGAPDGLADPATRTAAGASGYKLVGAVVSLASNSKIFSSALGVYGASMSVYSHFLSRGKDVTLQKNTPLEIALGGSHKP